MEKLLCAVDIDDNILYEITKDEAHRKGMHMAHPNGRLCGAKRPKCEAERSSPL